MQEERYDVVVIGSGPGGEGAAMRCAKGGKRVAVVERQPEVGGGCTHWGTIPSKALRHTIRVWSESRAFQQVQGRAESPSYPQMLAQAASVIRRQVDMRADFYDRNRVPVYAGHAVFADEHTVLVTDNRIPTHILRADHIVIAAGSRPYRPPELDFTHPRILDADTVLKLDYTPQSMTIYGAGVIGSEYASMFRNLGMKVNLVNNRDKLLAFLDDEIIDALSYHLREQGVLIRHNEELDCVEGHDDHVVLRLQSGKRVKSDVLLFAAGRTGNTDDMDLVNAGLQADHRGQVKVDTNYRTAVPHIYAVGDVVGFPSLASAAYDQGRFAGTHICEGRCDVSLAKNIPTGIYTSPEISSIGANERELTANKVPYEVGNANFRSIARAQIAGQPVGVLKILFHRETLEILGIHCFGDRAAEIVHIGQAIMMQPGKQNTIEWFVNTTFNYPTMAEAYRVAALNGLNRLF